MTFFHGFITADGKGRLARRCTIVTRFARTFGAVGIAGTGNGFDIATVFNRCRTDGNNACLRINGNSLRQGIFTAPFACSRVFVYRHGLRFFIFVVEVDNQFVGARRRGHNHAPLLAAIFHGRRRRRVNVGNFGFDAALSQYRTLRVAERQGVAFAAFKLAIFGDVQGELRTGLPCRDGNGLADRRLGKVSVIRSFVGKGDGNSDFFIRCFVQADGIGCRFAFFHLG